MHLRALCGQRVRCMSVFGVSACAVYTRVQCVQCILRVRVLSMFRSEHAPRHVSHVLRSICSCLRRIRLCRYESPLSTQKHAALAPTDGSAPSQDTETFLSSVSNSSFALSIPRMSSSSLEARFAMDVAHLSNRYRELSHPSLTPQFSPLTMTVDKTDILHQILRHVQAFREGYLTDTTFNMRINDLILHPEVKDNLSTFQASEYEACFSDSKLDYAAEVARILTCTEAHQVLNIDKRIADAPFEGDNRANIIYHHRRLLYMLENEYNTQMFEYDHESDYAIATRMLNTASDVIFEESPGRFMSAIYEGPNVETSVKPVDTEEVDQPEEVPVKAKRKLVRDENGGFKRPKGRAPNHQGRPGIWNSSLGEWE